MNIYATPTTTTEETVDALRSAVKFTAFTRKWVALDHAEVVETIMIDDEQYWKAIADDAQTGPITIHARQVILDALSNLPDTFTTPNNQH